MHFHVLSHRIANLSLKDIFTNKSPKAQKQQFRRLKYCVWFPIGFQVEAWFKFKTPTEIDPLDVDAAVGRAALRAWSGIVLWHRSTNHPNNGIFFWRAIGFQNPEWGSFHDMKLEVKAKFDQILKLTRPLISNDDVLSVIAKNTTKRQMTFQRSKAPQSFWEFGIIGVCSKGMLIGSGMYLRAFQVSESE